MENYLDKVPTLDLSNFTDGDKQSMNQFAQELGDSFNQTGFAIIKNHGLSNEITDQLYSTIKDFFDLSEEKKIKYYFPDLFGIQQVSFSLVKHRAILYYILHWLSSP